MPVETVENLVRIGMVAVIRDVQDYLDERVPLIFGGPSMVSANELRGYLLACLVVAGHVPEMPHGQG